MGNYNNLDVWKDSKNIAVKIYELTGKGKFNNDYSFRDQIRRAAISIPSNIAEGEESIYQKGSLRFFIIANASLAELKTQWEIANDIGYLNKDDFEILQNSLIVLSKRIKRLLQFRQEQLNIPRT